MNRTWHIERVRNGYVVEVKWHDTAPRSETWIAQDWREVILGLADSEPTHAQPTPPMTSETVEREQFVAWAVSCGIDGPLARGMWADGPDESDHVRKYLDALLDTGAPPEIDGDMPL